MSEMDNLDKKAATKLEGYLVRKDLVRTFSPAIPRSDLCRRVHARPLLCEH